MIDLYRYMIIMPSAILKREQYILIVDFFKLKQKLSIKNKQCHYKYVLKYFYWYIKKASYTS